MLRKVLLPLILVFAMTTGAVGQELTLRISSPADGTEVPERPFIEGAVTDQGATIRVIVHPMEVSEYWVQPAVGVKEDGKWKVMIYIGRPGTVDVGKRFEVMAVANPRIKLSEGTVLTEWPQAKAKSQIVELIRR